MRIRRTHHTERVAGFFRLGQSHETLANFITMNFYLFKLHNMPLDTIESMMPFEREAYIILLRQYLESLKEKNAR